MEASTIKGYRTEVKWVDRYIGDVRLSDLAIADVGTWMQDMSRRALPTPLAIAI